MSLFAMPLYHCNNEGEDVDVQGIHTTGLSAVKLWISSNKDHLIPPLPARSPAHAWKETFLAAFTPSQKDKQRV